MMSYLKYTVDINSIKYVLAIGLGSRGIVKSVQSAREDLVKPNYYTLTKIHIAMVLIDNNATHMLDSCIIYPSELDFIRNLYKK
jgi:hypothetical protein